MEWILSLAQIRIVELHGSNRQEPRRNGIQAKRRGAHNRRAGDIPGGLKTQLVNDTTLRFFLLDGQPATPDSSMIRICFGKKHFDRLPMTWMELDQQQDSQALCLGHGVGTWQVRAAEFLRMIRVRNTGRAHLRTYKFILSALELFCERL
jgi:hypothetical protein